MANNRTEEIRQSLWCDVLRHEVMNSRTAEVATSSADIALKAFDAAFPPKKPAVKKAR